MRRREFIAFLGGAAARPLAARAQAAMPVIGILHSQTEASEAERMSAIQRGLQEAGFVVGRNVSIEHRFADGRNDRLPALAVELVQRKVNVIFANTTPPAYAAKAATSTIPIVFVTGVDPVEVGLVASMNRPGANVTGVTFLSNKLVFKRLELLSAVTPVGSPIGMLAAQRNPNTETDVKDALTVAQMLKRTLHLFRPMAVSRPALPLCSSDGLGHCSSRRRRISECGSSNWCCLRRAMRCRRAFRAATT